MNSPTINNNDLINLDSLDDWLESDLRQSGILLPSAVDNKPFEMLSPALTPGLMMMASPPISECTPRMDPLLDLSTPLMKYEPLSPMETPKMLPQDISKSSIDLQPFIKALTLLGSIQYNQDTNTTTTTTTTNNNNNNNNTNNDDINNKRERSESIDDTQDMVVLKRQRNTDAARRSRQRKAQKMDTLEKRVLDLEADNERLRLRTAVAESERANVEAKEKRSRVRILELERQLADTHKALLRYSKSTSNTTNTTNTTTIAI